MIRSAVFLLALPVLALSARAALDAADTLQPQNTQKAGEEPIPAEAALKSVKVPEGFTTTLFAAEPDVRQPIDMKIDDRGRLWVAEAYSYGEWKKKGQDRILIFTDTDGDGRADQRKVFAAGLHHLSSIEVGYGGVWVLNSPELLFFPDANGDDLPDGPPKVILDGWTVDAKHNMASGLQWGPDGWLYGRHGITTPSMVGKEGASLEQRTFMEPGVWRYHPVDDSFDVVLRGMTNPWGMDWDENGELFLSGNVNGHLWYGLPGAWYERMFGAGSWPHDYERLNMIGDKPHYDSSGDWHKDWTRPDKGRNSANDMGGGHSHCGLMIYQGDNWPDQYRGQHFMCNTHGRRINQEAVSPLASGFVGKHTGDFAMMGDEWFKGVSLIYGPDGGVYVSDWSDHGECHDDDGVHRTSGRIYKIVHGGGKPAKVTQDLAAKTDNELVALTTEKNEWFVRHARRLLAERARGDTQTTGPVADKVRAIFHNDASPVNRQRALSTLQAAGWLDDADILAASGSQDEHLRTAAVRLWLDEHAPTDQEHARLLEMAAGEKSAHVRLWLAAALQRVAPGLRWPLATALVRRTDDLADNTMCLMLWYGVEPLVAADFVQGADLFAACQFPKLRQFIARRIASDLQDPEAREAFDKMLAASATNAALSADLLAGARTALTGRTGLTAPAAWPEAAARLLAGTDAAQREAATVLGLAFGDAATLESLRTRLQDQKLRAADRAAALHTLCLSGAADLRLLINNAWQEPVLRTAAIREMSRLDDAPDRLLKAWDELTPEQKSAAVDTLTSRADSARTLLDALAARKIQRSDISPGQARQILVLGEKKLTALLAKTWGAVTTTSGEKQAQIEKLRKLLTSAPATPADPKHGREVFTRTCATCHRLFGEGGQLGPDLTGSGRKSLDYLLPNIVDPSAAVPKDYKMTVLTLTDGQTLTGVVPAEDDQTLTLQSLTTRERIERSRIAKVEQMTYSWMPEGLLTQMPETDLRDLVAWLQSDGK